MKRYLPQFTENKGESSEVIWSTCGVPTSSWFYIVLTSGAQIFLHIGITWEFIKNIHLYTMAIKSQSVPGQWHLTKALTHVAWAENRYSKRLRIKKSCSFSELDPSKKWTQHWDNIEKEHRWKVVLGLESTFLNGRHLYLGSLRIQGYTEGLSSWEWTEQNLHGWYPCPNLGLLHILRDTQRV